MYTVLSFICFTISFTFLYLLIGHLTIIFEIIRCKREITIREILFPWTSEEYIGLDILLYIIHPLFFLMQFGICIDKCYNFLISIPYYLYIKFNNMKVLDYKIKFKKSNTNDTKPMIGD